ncbi:hypothetical protein D3C71_1964180 [compost metagenome]
MADQPTATALDKRVTDSEAAEIAQIFQSTPGQIGLRRISRGGLGPFYRQPGKHGLVGVLLKCGPTAVLILHG